MSIYVYYMPGKRRSGLANDRRAYNYIYPKYHPNPSVILNPSIIQNLSVQTYTITYNGNTNTSGTAPSYGSLRYTSGSNVTVLENSSSSMLEKTGFIFSGWNTSANGSGTFYLPGSTLTINADTVLYAVWSELMVLSPPTSLSSVAGNTEAYILFTQSGSVTNYEYSTDDGITFLEFNPPQVHSPVNISTLSSDGVTPLTNETTYTIKLKAINSGSLSVESVSVDVIPTITNLETTGRIIYLDANNTNSYSGFGNTWTNLDSSGLYSATLNGSPTFNEIDEPGNKYFMFNPGEITGQYSQINQSTAINPVLNTPFTIQMWVRINNIGSQGSLVSKVFGSPSYDGYALGYKTDTTLQLHENGSSQVNYFTSLNEVLRNGWAFYTANIQFGSGGGRQNKLFVNARQVLTATSNETGIPSSTQNMIFPTGFYGEGKCDIGQFYYYNTELTTTQIIQNFDATKHLYIS